jgi:hypothetical protein
LLVRERPTARRTSNSGSGTTFAAVAARRVSGRVWPGLLPMKDNCVRIILEVQDLPSGRGIPHSVASYVRAALKLRALRQELTQAVLEVARCKEALARRHQAGTLLTEAQALLEELGVEADVQ